MDAAAAPSHGVVGKCAAGNGRCRHRKLESPTVSRAVIDEDAVLNRVILKVEAHAPAFSDADNGVVIAEAAA